MSSWVRIDTRFPNHPKVLDIGPFGEALWLRGMCYAGEHLTDGFIPTRYITRMGDMKGLTVADVLVGAGLWAKTQGGYVIHDYLDWQRSRDEVADISSKRAASGSKGGKQRASNVLANAKQGAKQTPSNTQADKNREEKIREELTPLSPPEGETPKLKAVPKQRACGFPDDWTPGAAVLKVAQDLHMDESQMQREFAKFASHFRATGKTMVDWNQAAMNWLRRSLEMGTVGTQANGHKSIPARDNIHDWENDPTGGFGDLATRKAAT